MILKFTQSKMLAGLCLASSSLMATDVFANDLPPHYRSADCHPHYYRSMDPTRPASDTRSFDQQRDYGFLHWYEHGLEATLDNPGAVQGLGAGQLQNCRKGGPDCVLGGIVDVKKKTQKAAEDYLKEAKWGSAKKLAKHRKTLAEALPETLPFSALHAFEASRGRCGFTLNMIAELDKAREDAAMLRLASGTPEQMARQALCDEANARIFRRADTGERPISQSERVWRHRYNAAKEKGEFCEMPPDSLLTDSYVQLDPYGDMPFDMNEPERFMAFTKAVSFDANQPSEAECEAAYQAYAGMDMSAIAKMRPEETAWKTDYDTARARGDICSPIPARLARWGETYVRMRGWPFRYRKVSAEAGECRIAAEEIAARGLGGEYARWMQTYEMRWTYQIIRAPGEQVCPGVPGYLMAELSPLIQQSRQVRENERLAREAELRAQAAQKPKSLQELLEEYNRNYRPPVIKEKRCYLNQWGREHCYVR